MFLGDHLWSFTDKARLFINEYQLNNIGFNYNITLFERTVFKPILCSSIRDTNLEYRKTQLLAELQRAKRASGAPWVRKFGNPPSRENLVIT